MIQLVSIVVGWLLVSPKCDADRLDEALAQANDIACVATSNPDLVIRASSSESRLGSRRAFLFQKYDVRSPPSDESCTSPVFNYSRLLSWMVSVERVAEAFEAASRHAEDNLPVNKQLSWTPVEDELKEKLHVNNRRGTLDQVMDYCSLGVFWQPNFSRWHPNIVGRMIIASVIAITLQWTTAGSAIMVVWFTPTTRLGCRSGAYLLYAVASTIVWGLMLTSSVLMHYAVEARTLKYSYRMATTSQRVACAFACLANRLAKALAAINSIWIVAVCVFQFLNVFDNCYCNSSVLGRGKTHAYNVMAELPESDKTAMSRYWAGAISIAVSSSFMFIAYVTVFLNTSGLRPHRAH
jgi:hypothetical protein